MSLTSTPVLNPRFSISKRMKLTNSHVVRGSPRVKRKLNFDDEESMFKGKGIEARVQKVKLWQAKGHLKIKKENGVDGGDVEECLATKIVWGNDEEDGGFFKGRSDPVGRRLSGYDSWPSPLPKLGWGEIDGKGSYDDDAEEIGEMGGGGGDVGFDGGVDGGVGEGFDGEIQIEVFCENDGGIDGDRKTGVYGENYDEDDKNDDGEDIKDDEDYKDDDEDDKNDDGDSENDYEDSEWEEIKSLKIEGIWKRKDKKEERKRENINIFTETHKIVTQVEVQDMKSCVGNLILKEKESTIEDPSCFNLQSTTIKRKHKI